MRWWGTERGGGAFRPSWVVNLSTASDAVVIVKVQINMVVVATGPQSASSSSSDSDSGWKENISQCCRCTICVKTQTGQSTKPSRAFSQERKTWKSRRRPLRSPSSAFLSHSTNFFICSRNTLFPLARWASLYHFKIASSLKTSADKTKQKIKYINK